MAESKIEWTDVTDNIIVPEIGGHWCRKISPGCANCYAAHLNQNSFFGGNKLPYSGEAPKLKLRREICDKWENQRKPKKHFVASMTDVFGEWVPYEFIDYFLSSMYTAPKQTFQLLTKRPDNASKQIQRWLKESFLDELPSNIWIGTSIEDQKRADERIPELLNIPARVRFLSCEPLLGHIQLPFIDFPKAWEISRSVDIFKHDRKCSFRQMDGALLCDCDVINSINPLERIQWVICGGESGLNARPMNPDWARSLRDQCVVAEVPFFFKQWGEYAPNWYNDSDGNKIPDSEWIDRMGKKIAGRLLDGREWNEFPKAEEES